MCCDNLFPQLQTCAALVSSADCMYWAFLSNIVISNKWFVFIHVI